MGASVTLINSNKIEKPSVLISRPVMMTVYL